MEEFRDLSKLYDILFLDDRSLFQMFETQESKYIKHRWEYIGQFYPWLVFDPLFAKSFFQREYLEGDISKIQDTIYDFLIVKRRAKEISEQELESFMSRVSTDKILSTLKKIKEDYHPSLQYLMGILYRDSRNNIEKLLRDLDIFPRDMPERISQSLNSIRDSSILSRSLMKEVIKHEDTDTFKYLLGVYRNNKKFTDDTIHDVVYYSSLMDNFLDILYDYLVSIQGFESGYPTYNYILENIFKYLSFPDVSNVSSLLKWTSKHSGVSLRDLFLTYHKRMYIKFHSRDSILHFYAAFYQAGLPYEFLAETNKNVNIPILREWLYEQTDV